MRVIFGISGEARKRRRIGTAGVLRRVLARSQGVAHGIHRCPSPLDEGLLSTIEKTSEEFWRGVPVAPVMSAAGSDGTYLRNAGIPTYGHSGLAGDVDDVRAHGKDERVAVKSFREGSEYLYRLVKRLSGGN